MPAYQKPSKVHKIVLIVAGHKADNGKQIRRARLHHCNNNSNDDDDNMYATLTELQHKERIQHK